MNAIGEPHLPPIPRRFAAVAAILGWIVPGLGQVYVGRPGKGLFLFTVILSTYALGLWLAGFRCVDPTREPVWFAAEALAAGPTAAVAWLTRDLAFTHRIATYDVGLLYVAVASLLNAVAVADALGTIDGYERAAREEIGMPPLGSVAVAQEALGHPRNAAEDEWPPPEAFAPAASAEPLAAAPPAMPEERWPSPGDAVERT